MRTQQQSDELSLRDMNLPTVIYSLEEEVSMEGNPQRPSTLRRLMLVVWNMRTEDSTSDQHTIE